MNFKPMPLVHKASLLSRLRSKVFLAGAALIASWAAADASRAVPIAGLYNTGVLNTGVTIAAAGVPDPHYTLVAPANFTAQTVSDSNFPFPPWVPNVYGPGGSRWIGPTPGGNGPPFNYRYQTQFNLPANALLSTAMITGLWGTDDGSLDIWLNGNPQGQVSAGFTSLVPFMVTTGFQVGLNNLEFRLNNAGGPTGLRVDRIAGKYQVPEPLTAGAGVLSALVVAAAARRRRGGAG